MPMSHRLLRPIATAVSVLSYLLDALNGDNLVTISGDYMRTIQDA